MSISGYRRVLALPGVARLLGFAVLARIPYAAAGAALTLFVVLGMHRNYAAAGLVTAASTVGAAVGGPWRGHAIDAQGLRRALVPSVLADGVAWGAMPWLPLPGVAAAAFLGGMLGVPMFTVVRQSLAVLVPGERQRAAFALDSIGTELTFLVGPASGVLLATRWSPSAAVLTIGALFVLSGLALLAMNPPTRGADPPAAEHRSTGPPWRRTWFSSRLVAVLAVTAGAATVLSGTDVSIVANLRADGRLGDAWLVFAAWCAASIVGGLIFGAVRRPVSPAGLLLALGLLTAPVGLARGPLGLGAAMLAAGLMCAPVISATTVAVSRLVPESDRGEAMGWYATAITLGVSLGAPVAGLAIDHFGAWTGFAVVGAIGTMVAGFGLLAEALGHLKREPVGAEGPPIDRDWQLAPAVSGAVDGVPEAADVGGRFDEPPPLEALSAGPAHPAQKP